MDVELHAIRSTSRDIVAAKRPARLKRRSDKSGYYYLLSDHTYVEIEQIKHSGSVLDGWWDVSIADKASLLSRTLDEVRIFLGALGPLDD